jgi:membrane-associated phospholipid phosphatase
VTNLTGTPALVSPDGEKPERPIIGHIGTRILIGLGLLGAMAVFGVYVKHSPGPTLPDRIAFDVFPSEWQHHTLTYITDLGRPRVVVPGLAICFVLALFWDRRRAITCILGPAAAVGLTEYIAKPAVHRMLGGSLSYPSGHMTAVATLTTMFVMSVKPRFRKAALVVAIVVDCAMAATLMLLRWHYLTDIAAGLAVSVGTILIIDAVLHIDVSQAARHEPELKMVQQT